MTLRDLLTDWGDLYWMTGYSNYRILWFCQEANDRILSKIGDVHVDLLEEEDIRRILESDEYGSSEDTNRLYTLNTVLCSFFDFVCRIRATDNPVLKKYIRRNYKRKLYTYNEYPYPDELEIPFRFPDPVDD